ncbi:MFS general substrate transporter [Epithele typhae]|uniref:MFS general substrate transporter n=1 Tax=Epithele typhae TaxID=378194 RepID=UPI0020074B60|nr:MFS general substrate transporter [Epithele typhae]KAH9924322.1 MFS general substrate transporter [Epithele typhae]
MPSRPASADSKAPSFKDPTGDVEKTGFAVHVEEHDVYEGEDAAIDPVYYAKAKVLNLAFQEIGMGHYQWYLFFVAGFGWFADNLWLCLTGLIINPVTMEFAGFKGPFLILAQSIGLLFGAIFWGVGCDIWGRRISFNMTLLITSIFALAAGGAPTAIALCSLIATWNLGVGGNLPVDSAVFLEFVPASHQWLLTVLSIWWAIGQLVASLVAWPYIANFTCSSTEGCTKAANMGWRYYLWTMGGLMMFLFFLRVFVFHLYESPKYLMGKGEDEKAVEVIHEVARYNGKTSSLTLDMLKNAERTARSGGALTAVKSEDKAEQSVMPAMDTSMKARAMRKVSMVNTEHVKSLFATRKLAYSTSLLIVTWALIGLAFPLYNGFVTVFLASRGADFGDGSLYITYRNQVILSIMGIPGALLAGYLVEHPWLGRKGTLAISTALTGVFLFASTTARTSDALLGWNCGYTFTSNVMYGVLYAVSPELFPTKDRGTGNAIVSAANRIFGIMVRLALPSFSLLADLWMQAPIIALYADLSTPVPIYVSGTLFIVAGFIALLLPFEPRGKAAI